MGQMKDAPRVSAALSSVPDSKCPVEVVAWIAAESSENIETMVVHDVDVELLRRHKLRGTVQNWNDRRRDLYAVTWSEEADHHSI